MSLPYYKRSSQRMTITIPFHVHERLCSLAADQGRSHSNLTAYILERGLELLFPTGNQT